MNRIHCLQMAFAQERLPPKLPPRVGACNMVRRLLCTTEVANRDERLRRLRHAVAQRGRNADAASTPSGRALAKSPISLCCSARLVIESSVSGCSSPRVRRHRNLLHQQQRTGIVAGRLLERHGRLLATKSRPHHPPGGP